MTKRRFALAVLIGLLVATADLRAQTFTGQLLNFWNQLRTGALQITTASVGSITAATRVTIGNGTNTIPASQLFFMSFSQDSILRMVIENRSATANADAEIKLINGSGTAFMGVTNINNTVNGPQTVPGGAHRSWLDISDNTAGAGWDIGFAAPAGVSRFYTGGYTAGNFRLWIEATAVSLKNSECLGAEAATAGNDSTISRTAAATWAVGNGTCGDTSGTIRGLFQNNAATVTTTNAATAAFLTNGVGGAGGPTTAAQNGWIVIKDSAGASTWVPVWK